MHEEFTPLKFATEIKAKRSWRAFMRDYAIYTSIGLAFIVPIYAAVVFDWNFRLVEAVFFGVFIACVVLGTEVGTRPELWRESKFRLFLLIYCLGHITAFYLLHRFVPVVRGWHMTVLVIAEIAVVSDVLKGRMRFFRRLAK